MIALTRIFLCLTLCFAVCLAANPPTACKAKLLGCPPGTIKVEKGKDEQGCPIHECKRCPPPAECTPFHKLRKVVLPGIPGLCPLYICEKACPPSIIPECPACHIPIPHEDENGCPKLICELVRCPKCPPNTHEIRFKKSDRCGCPDIVCHIDPKINFVG